jgi:hypothetical protein
MLFLHDLGAFMFAYSMVEFAWLIALRFWRLFLIVLFGNLVLTIYVWALVAPPLCVEMLDPLT